MSTLVRGTGLLVLAVVAILVGEYGRAEEPYVASVGADDAIAKFYIEPRLYQFTLQTEATDSAESFTVGRGASLAPEVCNLDFDGGSQNIGAEVNANWMIPRGGRGHFQWIVRLPHRPSGNLILALQCGVLKPNAAFLFDEPVLKCAGEEGEYADVNCTRRLDQPGVSGVVPNRYLPRLTVAALVGNGLSVESVPPFNLTAYRNPATHELTLGADGSRLSDSSSLQVMDGSRNTSIVMKACMEKSIVLKKPVTGQINALGQRELDLEEGDFIAVRLDLPRGHTMDVFCHEDSVKIMGIGAPAFFLERPERRDFAVVARDTGT